MRGTTSFEDLKTIGGVVASTFCEAALLCGLLEADNCLDKCLEEASMYQMTYSLRHLVDFKVTFDEDQMGSREIHDELKISISEEDLLEAESLNAKQKYAYERILEKVFSNTPRAFFIDGPGGTGKTFLYRALLATIRSKHHVALATTSSGLAASILLGVEQHIHNLRFLLMLRTI